MSSKRRPDQTRIKITWQDPAMIQVGKSGVSEGLVKELTRLLKSHRYLKVRVLKSALGGERTKESLLDELCTKTGATLTGFRGNTAVIYRLR